MEKFTKLEGVAAPLKMINVDTDMIIPKQYLKTIKRTGLGKGLFSEKRYRDDGSENPDFVLNKPAYRKAKILVAGDNFGCGSSREHAPWALMDFGISCVISTSFGDIFYNNCFKNGVLPIKVSPEDLEKLFDDAERGANATLSIDLEKQEIRGPDGGVVKFDIDAHRKHCMLNGLDDIGLTMVKGDKIDELRGEVEGRAAVGMSVASGPSWHPDRISVSVARCRLKVPAGGRNNHEFCHFHLEYLENLCLRFSRPQDHQSRHPARRDFRPARSERRRQDHADQHHLRHRETVRKAPSRSTATTSSRTTAPRAR